MENEIDKFTHFSLEEALDYINIGKKLLAKKVTIDEFKKYCRNYFNFLINHTEFNYLLYCFGDINDKIIKDYDNNYQQMNLLIKLNNILLESIYYNKLNQTDKLLKDVKFSWEPLNKYCENLKNINNLAKIDLVGDTRIKSVYIDTKILIKKLDKIDTLEKIYWIDLFKFYYNICTKTYNFMIKNNQNNNDINKIKNELNYFLLLDNSDKIKIIKQNLNLIEKYFESVEELEVFLIEKNNRKNNFFLKKKQNDYTIPLVIAGTLTVLSGILLKLNV